MYRVILLDFVDTTHGLKMETDYAHHQEGKRKMKREKEREEVILASCLMVSTGSEAWIKSLPSKILPVLSLECSIFRILRSWYS